MCLVQAFTGGNKNTRKQDGLDRFEKSPSPFALLTEQHLKWWFFRNERSNEEVMLSFEMRQFFPEEIDALLWNSDFLIEHEYGNYNEEDFSSDAWKQLIICHLK